MHALALVCALTAFFTSSVCASPVPRQTGGVGYLTNDYLGTALTIQSLTEVSGIPVGLSPLSADGPAENQLFWLIPYVDGDTGDLTGWALSSYSVSNLLVSITQTTSSDDYSPGYEMLQTNTQYVELFTLTPGYDAGSYYFSPNSNGGMTPDPQYQLNWYVYDDPAADFIPVIIDAAVAESSQSFTWHPY